MGDSSTAAHEPDDIWLSVLTLEATVGLKLLNSAGNSVETGPYMAVRQQAGTNTVHDVRGFITSLSTRYKARARVKI